MKFKRENKEALNKVPYIVDSFRSIWWVARNCFVHFDNEYCIVKTELAYTGEAQKENETVFTIHKENKKSGVFVDTWKWSYKLESNDYSKEDALITLGNIKKGITKESQKEFYNDCVEKVS